MVSPGQGPTARRSRARPGERAFAMRTRIRLDPTALGALWTGTHAEATLFLRALLARREPAAQSSPTAPDHATGKDRQSLALRLGIAILRLGARLGWRMGWRVAASAAGLAGAAWLVGAVPRMLDNPAQARDTAEVRIGSTITATAAPAHQPDWQPVPRPVAVFALGLPELEGQPLWQRARRDQTSPLREDQIGAGQFGSDDVHVAISLARARAGNPGSFYIEMTRHAASHGLSIERSGQPVPLVTKFGPMETADALLAGSGRDRACLLFRHAASEAGFTLQGWLCGSARRAADRQQLTCLIDRLNLIGGGDDRALKGAFSRAELNRQAACITPKLQATGRKSTWLDADQDTPRLRRSGG
jgi:hypothetical protein